MCSLRTLSTLGALALTLAGASAPRARAAELTQSQAQQIGLDAYTYGIPLMEFVRQQRQQTSVTVPNALSDAPLNEFGSARELANATNQVIVQSNNDTLYTMGHLNLSRGPLVLHVPRVAHHRYYTIEFIDPYTNVFHYVGTRATGDGRGDYAITGPRWHGRLPRGLRRIRSAYDRVWLAGRTLVDGPRDLPAVHRVQNGYRLIPLAAFRRLGLRYRAPRPKRVVRVHTKALEPSGVPFFDALGDALAANPPPAVDAPRLAELAAAGIGPGKHPSRENLPPAVLAGLAAAAAAGPAHVYALRLAIGAKSVASHNGWFVAPPDIAAFGTDYDLRAVVALYGIAANRPIEAMYPIGAADTSLSLLNGAHSYVMHFAPGRLPPARYFWSLTMYDAGFLLVPNPINRYQLGDRSRGLRRNADGSLDVYLSRAAPVGHESNWLPSPAGGFEVTMRLYGPGPSALNDTYVYPTITRTG